MNAAVIAILNHAPDPQGIAYASNITLSFPILLYHVIILSIAIIFPIFFFFYFYYENFMLTPFHSYFGNTRMVEEVTINNKLPSIQQINILDLIPLLADKKAIILTECSLQGPICYQCQFSAVVKVDSQ